MSLFTRLLPFAPTAIAAGLSLTPSTLAQNGVDAVEPTVQQTETVDQRFQSLEREIARQREVIESQQAQLDRLAASEHSWLTEARARQIRGLVVDALADADARASLRADGAVAGYDKGFFIGSSDGNFRLQLAVESQFRYIWSSSEQPAGVDEDTGGFQVRRARLDFRGHAFDPALTYRLRFAVDRATGSTSLEFAHVGYDLSPEWNIKAGQFKPLFLREENVAGTRQLAIERSYVADYITVDYAQGAELTYTGSWLRAAAAVHDGSYSANTDFNADRTDLALSGRVEARFGGSWKQFDDFSSWSGDEVAVLVGVAAGYEAGSAAPTDLPDVFKYTADLSVEFGFATLFASVVGQQFEEASAFSFVEDASQFGFVAQAGVFVIPDRLELFGRYEWFDFDGGYYRNNGAGTQTGTGAVASDEIAFATVGANYYIYKHNLKLSLDVVLGFDPVPVGNTGAGIVATGDDGSVALRSQVQWSF
jgi:hypothetical protein